MSLLQELFFTEGHNLFRKTNKNGVIKLQPVVFMWLLFPPVLHWLAPVVSKSVRKTGLQISGVWVSKANSGRDGNRSPRGAGPLGSLERELVTVGISMVTMSPSFYLAHRVNKSIVIMWIRCVKMYEVEDEKKCLSGQLLLVNSMPADSNLPCPSSPSAFLSLNDLQCKCILT